MTQNTLKKPSKPKFPKEVTRKHFEFLCGSVSLEELIEKSYELCDTNGGDRSTIRIDIDEYWTGYEDCDTSIAIQFIEDDSSFSARKTQYEDDKKQYLIRKKEYEQNLEEYRRLLKIKKDQKEAEKKEREIKELETRLSELKGN